MFDRNYLVIYDISSDKIRKKVVKILENYGIRVQYSSFECHLNYSSKKSLTREVGAIIEAADSVRLYRMSDKTEEVNKPEQINRIRKKTVLI